MEKKRSVGVTILAISLILMGISNLLSYALYTTFISGIESPFTAEMYREFMLRSTPLMSQEGIEQFEREVMPFFEKMSQAQNEMVGSNFWDGILKMNTVVGVIVFIFGIGLLRLKEYARRGTVILMWLLIPTITIFMYMAMCNMIEITAKYLPEINRTPVTISCFLPIMAIFQGLIISSVNLVVVYFLTRPKVKEQFK